MIHDFVNIYLIKRTAKIGKSISANQVFFPVFSPKSGKIYEKRPEIE